MGLWVFISGPYSFWELCGGFMIFGVLTFPRSSDRLRGKITRTQHIYKDISAGTSAHLIRVFHKTSAHL